MDPDFAAFLQRLDMQARRRERHARYVTLPTSLAFGAAGGVVVARLIEHSDWWTLGLFAVVVVAAFVRDFWG